MTNECPLLVIDGKELLPVGADLRAGGWGAWGSMRGSLEGAWREFGGSMGGV